MTENVLRDKMEQIVKRELRSLLLKTRADMKFTQSKMGDRYVMSENSYSALENGEYMCGTLTAILLLKDQRDPNMILAELSEKFEKLREEELLPL